jgi:hypothetical protein
VAQVDQVPDKSTQIFSLIWIAIIKQVCYKPRREYHITTKKLDVVLLVARSSFGRCDTSLKTPEVTTCKNTRMVLHTPIVNTSERKAQRHLKTSGRLVNNLTDKSMCVGPAYLE